MYTKGGLCDPCYPSDPLKNTQEATCITGSWLAVSATAEEQSCAHQCLSILKD